MVNSDKQLLDDVERIQSLDIVPSILELVCRTTGMGFAAVARVTDDKWIACAVKDDVNFGLTPGGELELRTTICNEIRAHRQAVVIDEVKEDPVFATHHTPKMYGFQSYISIPIFLKNGQFFGTLCAIDPKPLPLKANNTVKMFELYADLISFHLHEQEQSVAKNELVANLEEKLKASLQDIDQYVHISQHTLQEPLRKLRVFSDLLMAESRQESQIIKELALEINALSRRVSVIITELGTFSSIPDPQVSFETINLNDILNDALAVLSDKVVDKNAAIEAQLLPGVEGVRAQIGKLFVNLLDNALKFHKPDEAPRVKVYAMIVTGEEAATAGLDGSGEYYKIVFEDNGIGIHEEQLPLIFNLFTRFGADANNSGVGVGLPQSRRIMYNHRGALHVQSQPAQGATFTLWFPKPL